MPGSAFDPTGFSRRAAALVIGATVAAGAAGVGWWQTHLSTSPSCQITAPAAGTVTGTVAITATCGSTATGVSFDVNGGAVGSAIALPFGTSWNSAGVTDGTYSLTAVSTDANGNTVTSAAVSITTSNGVSGGSGPLTANVWVSPFGSDANAGCVRHGTKVTDPGASSDCLTPQKAYTVATTSGDVVGVASGSYAGGFAITTSCKTSTPITFQTQTGGFADFELWGEFGCSDITLQGDSAQVGYGVGFSLGHMKIDSTSSNVTWNSVNLYCQSANQASGNWLQIYYATANEYGCNDSVEISGDFFTWNGGDQEADLTCVAHGCTLSHLPSGSTNGNDDFINPGASNILIEHVIFKNHWAVGTGLHDENWFLSGGDIVEFLDNSMTDCAPAAFTGYAETVQSCDTGYFFVGASGSSNTVDHLTMIQNIIAPGHSVAGSQKAVQFGDNRPTTDAGHEPTYTFLYNDFDGGVAICQPSGSILCQPAQSNMTGANITWVGNVSALGTSSCFASGTYLDNTWWQNGSNTSGNCGVTDQHFNSTPDTNFWTSPGPPNYDYTPLAVIQAKGENSFCPATDINGTTRPTLTACDAGAVQH